MLKEDPTVRNQLDPFIRFDRTPTSVRQTQADSYSLVPR